MLALCVTALFLPLHNFNYIHFICSYCSYAMCSVCRDRHRFSTDVRCLAGNEARWQFTQNSSYFPLVCHLHQVQWDPPRKTTEKERHRLFLTPLFSNSSLSLGRLVHPVVIYFISFSFFSLVSFKNTFLLCTDIFFSLGLFISPMT